MSDPVLITETGKRYRDISTALRIAVPGQTVSVAAGTYAESLTIARDISLVAAEEGVFVRSPSPHPALEVTAGHASVRGIGFVLDPGPPKTAAVLVTGGTLRMEACKVWSKELGVAAMGAGVRLELRSCVVADTDDTAVLIADGASGDVVSTAVVRSRAVALRIYEPGGPVRVQRNRIDQIGGFGIQAVRVSNLAVVRNEIKRTAGSGIVLDASAGAIVIDENRIADVAAHGIEFGNTHGAVANRNTIDGARHSGVSVYGQRSNVTLIQNRLSSIAGHGVQVIQQATANVEANRIASTGGFGIVVGQQSTSATILRNAIEGTGRAAIFVNAGANAQVEGNEVATTGNCLVVADPGTSARVHANHFRVETPRIAGIYINNGAAADLAGNQLHCDARAAVAMLHAGRVTSSADVSVSGGREEPAGIIEILNERLLAEFVP